ncbi:MAG: hypothetical protein ACT4O1_06330 [Gemmatimonadota bacterium]
MRGTEDSVGPGLAMTNKRRIVRMCAAVVGTGAGIVLFPFCLAAAFTLRNEDLPEGLVALMTPVLMVPLVIVALVWPRPGGMAITFSAAVSAAAFLWSLVGSPAAAPAQVTAMLGLYAALGGIGAAFWWSGLTAVELRQASEDQSP